MSRLLRFVLAAVMAATTLSLLAPVLADTGAQTCYPYCAEPTPSPAPCVGELDCYGIGDPGEESAQVWSGYNDGRLNPRLDEYYSVWCESGLIKIYRAVPETLLLKSIPITLASQLGVGAVLDIGDFMTLVRNSENTMTIYGSNGNLAPQPGEKAFSLSECRERNGGAPALVPAVTPTPTPTPTPNPASSVPQNFITRDALFGEIAAILRLLSCAGVFTLPGGFGLLRWTRRKRKVQ